ncbi:MAG: DUF445 family protein [Gemmatimonadota bacterium]|nr:MAG: DUF445 family protein [Gemmatimonadota bacterium]
MIAEPSLLRAVVTIGFGAMAGGLTNAVAIWMLFHPYEPRGLKSLKLHGAIPKNKARLAKTIGRTVGERLLSSDDLASQLSAPGVREAFHGAVESFVTSLLKDDRESLRDELPPAFLTEIEAAIESIAAVVADRVVDYANTDGFRDKAAEFLTRTRDQVADQPIGDLLTAARREAIRSRVEQWVSDAAASPELDRLIEEWLDRQLVRLAGDETPLLERLPRALIAAVEKEIADYLPMAIDRLARVLADPIARHRIQDALHQLFERFVRDLLIHERIVARLVVTERTITKVLDNFERDGADQLANLLDQPEMRNQVARSVNDAVVNFLRRPMSDHLARLGPERIEGVKKTAAEQIAAVIRDPASRRYGIEKLDQALLAAEGRTWGEILRHLPPDQAADWLARSMRDPKVHTWVEDGTRMALTALLDRRIGRPADWLPAGSAGRIVNALAPALWDWTQRQVPVVVEKVDVQTMVEEKVLGFSLERIEQIIRNTTQRELDLIVRLGYVLGAVVGGAAYVISLFL